VINKIVRGLESAVAGIESGSTVLISGFGDSGRPNALLTHLARCGLRDLTIVSNNAGVGSDGLAQLLAAGSIRRLIASYPRSSDGAIFEALYRSKDVELELVPQGTLSERIRAAGAGLAGFYTPTGVGTMLADGREHREFDGRTYVLERPLRADWALIRAKRADRWGNVTYNKSQRNYGPAMAMAGDVTVVEVSEIVALGDLDPEAIVTPGVFVNRIVEVPA
jgi:3-oxoadipate CoA-transferase, alpha subunit